MRISFRPTAPSRLGDGGYDTFVRSHTMTDPADVTDPAECEYCTGRVTDHDPTCRTSLDFPEVPADYDDFVHQASQALAFGPGA